MNGDDVNDYADNDEYRRIGSIRRLFNRDYYKPIRTDYGFGGRINNYTKYSSRGDRHEHLSPEKYLDMIRPYSKDLINGHKPTEELNNDGDTELGEWKVQLVMQNNCIPTKDFEET